VEEGGRGGVGVVEVGKGGGGVGVEKIRIYDGGVGGVENGVDECRVEVTPERG